MVKKGYSPEEIKNELGKYGYRASLPALQAYVKKNPVDVFYLENDELTPEIINELERLFASNWKRFNKRMLLLILEKLNSEPLTMNELLKYLNANLEGSLDKPLTRYDLSTFALNKRPTLFYQTDGRRINAKISLNNTGKVVLQYLRNIKIKKNPTCKSAGMTSAKRKAYNEKHGSNVKKGVTDITSMEKLRRWGAWATRFYGRKDKPALVKEEYFTPLSCSAIAWGNNPPANWREAGKIYRRGKEALDTYKTLKDKYGYSPKQKFTTKERNFLNRAFLDFVK